MVADWFSAPVIPIDDYTSELVEFSGRWIGELQTTQVKWIPGARARDNPTGRSGHEHFPAVFIANQNSNNNSGKAYGLHYGWSGGHKMVAEELPDGRRQIQMGHASGSYREAALSFKTAPLYMAYGDYGLNSVSTQFQNFLSGQLKLKPASKKPRPIHYNCWEAIYFKHSLERLKELAQKAAEIGAERFVLDDGWFGKRNNDKTSLGDWNVDYEKYPNGLSPLIDHIKDLGLADDLINLKGLTPGMLVTLGEQKILNLEDFADLASDELTGGFDIVKGERVKIQGYLEDFALSKTEADELIMSARKIVYKD